MVVEGFANPEGDYLYNLNESLQRSQRVICVLLAKQDPSEHAMTDANVNKSATFSWLVNSFNAAKYNSVTANYDESRRVELRLEFLGIGERRPATEPPGRVISANAR